MRLPTLVDRWFKAQEPSPGPPEGEKGVAGGFTSSGVATGEYLQEWTFPRYVSVIEEMRRVDPAIKTLEQIVSLPLLSLSWYVEPSPDGGEDEASLIEQNLLEGMTITWQEFLEHAVRAIFYGFYPLEKVVERRDGRHMYRKIAPRHPATISKFHFDEHGGLQALTQTAYSPESGFVSREIEIERLVIFIWQREAGNPTGSSLLRAAYRPYLIRDQLLNWLVIGMQRSWVGFPIGTVPRGTKDRDKEEFLGLIKAIGASEKGGIVKHDGFVVELLEGRRSPADMLPILQHLEREIVSCALAQFLTLGATNVGSRALSDSHGRFFILGVRAAAQWLADTATRFIIDPWYRWNFPSAPRGRLAYTDPAHVLNVGEISEALRSLVEHQIVIPDAGIEDFSRSLLGLPERPQPAQPAEREAGERRFFAVGAR